MAIILMNQDIMIKRKDPPPSLIAQVYYMKMPQIDGSYHTHVTSKVLKTKDTNQNKEWITST